MLPLAPPLNRSHSLFVIIRVTLLGRFCNQVHIISFSPRDSCFCFWASAGTSNKIQGTDSICQNNKLDSAVADFAVLACVFKILFSL